MLSVYVLFLHALKNQGLIEKASKKKSEGNRESILRCLQEYVVTPAFIFNNPGPGNGQFIRLRGSCFLLASNIELRVMIKFTLFTLISNFYSVFNDYTFKRLPKNSIWLILLGICSHSNAW